MTLINLTEYNPKKPILHYIFTLLLSGFYILNIAAQTPFTGNDERVEVRGADNFYIAKTLQDKKLLKAFAKEKTNSTAFHLFSHGKPGELMLKGEWLGKEDLAHFIKPLIRNKNYLNIYGCNFAKGKKGQAAVAYLEKHLGISVAASDDVTGIDGDWDLEVGTSVNVAMQDMLHDYSHNLQGYIDCATILNDDEGFYDGHDMVIKDGYTYIYLSLQYYNTTDNRFPVVNGQSHGTTDLEAYVAVFDPACHLIFSSFIGGSGSERHNEIVVADNGDFYLTGETESNDFPTTDGTTVMGSDDVYVQRYSRTGILFFSTIYGGSNRDTPRDIFIDGTDVYVVGETRSADFTTTNGSTYAGSGDGFIIKYDSGGSFEYAGVLGGTGVDEFTNVTATGGNVFISGKSNSTDFPTTDGSALAGGGYNPILASYDATGNLRFSTLLGANTSALFLETDGSFVYLMGETSSSNFPTTNGAINTGSTSVYLRKYDLAGNLDYSTVLGSSGNDDAVDFVISGGEAYVLITINTSGSYVFTTDGTGTLNDAYVLFTKLGTDGSIVFSTLHQSSGEDIMGMDINNIGEIFWAEEAYGVPATDGTSGEGTLIVKYNSDGSLCTSTVINNFQAPNIYPGGIGVIGDTVWILKTIYQPPSISTDGTAYTDGYEFVLNKFVFCPTEPTIGTNNLSPATQNVCANGLVAQLIGDEHVYDSNDFPLIYSNGVASNQSIPLQYQWQVSDNSGGPWTDIVGPVGQQKNYTPAPTTLNQYYRRLTKTAECCGGTTLSTSSTAAVIVGANTAPTVDAGGTFYTCPSHTFTIGSSPAATGGTSPYTYDWNDGAFTVEMPSISPSESGIYTLIVTDANGCQQADQATVVVYNANAGTNSSVCEGEGTAIGGNALAGVPIVNSGDTPPAGIYSIEYTWSPATGLSCTDCPNPTATPAADTDYNLEVTLNFPDGSTCTTSDMVQVGVYAAPSNPNFAGADAVVCLGEEVLLGGAAEVLGTATISAVTQTSIGIGTATVANLTDGDFTTGGHTNDGDTLTIDLGSIQTISKIQYAALSGATNDEAFYIELSTDNVNFTEVGVTFSASATVLTNLYFSAQDARYIRFRARYSFSDVSISEVSASLEYRYSWTPGSYIITNESYATFDAGNLEMPELNPITYTVTANLGTCNFYDQVTVAVIEARADEDYCGPRTVGELDRTPNIDETYSWAKITDPGITTGTGDFTGAMDEAIVPVSASVGGDVGYELTVSHTLNGSTAICKDTVIVPPLCGPGCDIATLDGNCPSFDNGQPTLIAYPPNTDRSLWTYSWTSDQGIVGLDNYTNDTVTLTDNISRRYYVTFTSTIDPSFTCVDSIDANSASFSTPNFSATSPVSTCAGTPVNIGDPANVAGLSYQWSSGAMLNYDTINYPEATVNTTTEFTVTVTDEVTGCFVVDTVLVEVAQIANAGPDLVVCDNGIVTVGSNTELAGYTYSWSPAGADWRNGTDQNDAMPDVFASITQTLTLTLTDPTSTCVSMDDMTITVENIPAPFTLPGLSYCPSQGTDLVLGTDDGTTTGTNQVPTGYNYLWGPGPVSNPTAINPTVSTPLPSSSTTYEVRVSTPGGCNQIASQTINPIVTSPLVNSNRTICLGETVQIGDDANPTGGGETYLWSPATDLDDINAVNPTFSPSTAGTTTFTLTKTVAGCSATSEVTITVNEVTAPILTPQNICAGKSVQIGTTSNNILSYDWSPTVDLDDAFIANPTFSGTTTTNYTLTVFDGNGCSAQATTSVTVSGTAPSITLSDTTVCQVSNIVLNASVSPIGSYAYSWSPTDYLSNSNDLNPTFFIPGTGEHTYTLEVTDQSTGCSNDENIAITLTAESVPTLAASSSNPTTCGGSDGSISLTLINVPDGTYTINYQDGVPSVQTFTNVVVSSGMTTISGLSEGMYNDLSITVLGCISTENVDVILTDPSVPTLAASSSNPTTCGGSEGSITLTLTHVPNGIYTINYMDSAPSAQTFTNVAVSGGSATISGLSEGTYNNLNITVAGCTSTEDVDIILVDPSPPTALITPTTACNGRMNSIEATPLNGSGTYSTHLWTDLGTGTATGYALSNVNAQILTINATGTTGTIDLQYTVTDDANCSATINHTVMITQPDAVTLCEDGNNSATLTAQAGLINVVWFNSSDVQIGTGSTITIDATTMGLEDGSETFYYTADEGTGCSIGLCCPIVVTLETCAYDYGDLPDSSATMNTSDYQTLLANNGPRHKIISGLYLGSSVDDELDGQPSNDALGDTGDEDGLAMYASLDLFPGLTFRLPFSYVNTTGETAHVEAWIDWNGDGAFDGVGEMIADWDDGMTALPDRLEVIIPDNVEVGGLLGLRIRISNQDNMTPYGLQLNGEVEDYLIGIKCPQVCIPIQTEIIKK